MELQIHKTGFDFFDGLTALGVCITLSYAYQVDIQLTNEVGLYNLEYEQNSTIPQHDFLLTDLLELPSPDEIYRFDTKIFEQPIRFSNLDGLLASSYTIPGGRSPSFFDLYRSVEKNPERITACLNKVNQLIGKLQKTLAYYKKKNLSLICEIEKTYSIHKFSAVTFSQIKGSGTSIPMAIEPFLSFSSRSAIPDTNISNRVNIFVTEPRFVGPMAFIGAARFLRAHVVNGNFINLYLPLPKSITINRDSCLPLLHFSESYSRVCIASQLLFFSLRSIHSPTKKMKVSGEWTGLAFQSMLTHGIMQPISISAGVLEFVRMRKIVACVGVQLIIQWRRLLEIEPKIGFLDNRLLAEFILSPRLENWLEHLQDCIKKNRPLLGRRLFSYTIKELKEITKIMEDGEKKPTWSHLLSKNKGSYHIGCAIRLLRKNDFFVYRELINSLGTVKTVDQLIHFVGQVCYECSLAFIENRFIFIPDDTDLNHFAKEVEDYGVAKISELIQMVAYADYSKKDDPERTQKTEGK